MYKIESRIKLPDTDAAGILFYGNYFRLAHDAYEAFMDEIEFSLVHVLGDSPVLLLIAHAESDYRSSLNLGDSYTIQLKVEKIGRTSFVLAYHFISGSGETCATMKTVHVAVSKETQKPVGLPESLRKGLSPHA
jgi:YbgC/YbaW family acyl-CoA thioester hydrolase